MSSELKVVVTTFPDPETAARVAGLLVDAGLAACAQVGAEMKSYYRWDGTVKCDPETRVTFKVLAERFDLFTGELKLQHPYDIPQIVSWPAEYVDRAYLDWAKGKKK